MTYSIDKNDKYFERNIPKTSGSKSGSYYTNIIRDLLIFGGAIMLLGLPYFRDYISLPLFISLLFILSLGILAGILGPFLKKVIFIDIGVSSVAFIAFEYHAVLAYQEFGAHNAFFLVNQILSLVFFISTYYAVKGANNLYVQS